MQECLLPTLSACAAHPPSTRISPKTVVVGETELRCRVGSVPQRLIMVRRCALISIRLQVLRASGTGRYVSVFAVVFRIVSSLDLDMLR